MTNRQRVGGTVAVGTEATGSYITAFSSGDWLSCFRNAKEQAACRRSEPDLHVVVATGNTVRCGLPPGRISIQSLDDKHGTVNGNDLPNCSEIKEVPHEILREVVSLGMTRSFWSAGHLYQEDLVPSCGSSPRDLHVSSAPYYGHWVNNQAGGCGG